MYVNVRNCLLNRENGRGSNFGRDSTHLTVFRGGISAPAGEVGLRSAEGEAVEAGCGRSGGKARVDRGRSGSGGGRGRGVEVLGRVEADIPQETLGVR